MSRTNYTAFEGVKLFAHGPLTEVVLKIKKHITKADHTTILIFSDETGKTIDFNFQGSDKDVLKRLEIYTTPEPPLDSSGPGRPKLGVVSREVSLLPRHWEWLASQPGGASSTLRKLVEDAKKKSSENQSIKQSQEKTYRFMSVVAGDFSDYEEVLRALYKKDEKKFLSLIESWPNDIQKHLIKLSAFVFENK